MAFFGWDPNLGLGDRLQIRWAGWRGMKWALLMSTPWKVGLWGHPQAVVIQLGENDFPGEKGIVLSRTITGDCRLYDGSRQIHLCFGLAC